MYCSNCGKSVYDHAQFCFNCGKKISGTYKETQNDAKLNQNEVNSNESSSNYLEDKIKSKSKVRLIIGILLFVAGTVILVFQFNFIVNVFNGPSLVDGQSLESQLLAGKIEDVNVTLPLKQGFVYPTGYTYTTTSNSTTDTVAEFYATLLGKHILIIRGQPNQLPSGNLTGFIKPLNSDLKEKIDVDFNKDQDLKKLTPYILPYMITNEGLFDMDEFWISLVGLILFLGGGLLFLRRISDPNDKKNITYSFLKQAGYKNISELSNEFLKSENGSIKLNKGYKLNHKFLYVEKFLSVELYPLSQASWIYKKVTTHKTNFITTGKSYSLVIHFKPKKVVQLEMSDEACNQQIKYLMLLLPNVKFGYR